MLAEVAHVVQRARLSIKEVLILYVIQTQVNRRDDKLLTFLLFICLRGRQATQTEKFLIISIAILTTARASSHRCHLLSSVGYLAGAFPSFEDIAAAVASLLDILGLCDIDIVFSLDQVAAKFPFHLFKLL